MRTHINIYCVLHTLRYENRKQDRVKYLQL